MGIGDGKRQKIRTTGGCAPRQSRGRLALQAGGIKINAKTPNSAAVRHFFMRRLGLAVPSFPRGRRRNMDILIAGTLFNCLL